MMRLDGVQNQGSRAVSGRATAVAERPRTGQTDTLAASNFREWQGKGESRKKYLEQRIRVQQG